MTDVDPAQAPQQIGNPFLNEAVLEMSWRERGGFGGFFSGRQSLALSYWFLGVTMSVVLTAAAYLTAQIVGNRGGRVMMYGVGLVAFSRMISWYAVLKCRRNTSSELWTAAALITILVDVVYGFLTWPMFLWLAQATGSPA